MIEDTIQTTVNLRASSELIASRPIRRIPLMQPSIDAEMLEAALQALQNEKFVLGESVHKFEEEFARFCGTRYAISTGSGTAALQIALQAMNISVEDEVLTTPFSFFATSNAVIHAGAKPTFADVGTTGFNLDPSKAKESLSPKTKAIIPVHLYGHPCNMDEFSDIAEDKGLRLIEDACQAHGAEYQGKRVGSFGDAGCFSFYPSKNMTVGGDGGMIVTNDEDVAKAAASLRDCGRESKYTMSRIGYTSRLNTVNAAIGRVQLRNLPKWTEARRNVAGMYRRALRGIDQITLSPEDNGTMSVYHLFVIRSSNREGIIHALKQGGVETGIHYPVPIHLQPPYRSMYGYQEGSFPVSERLAEEVLSLPLYPGLTEDDVAYISGLVREAASVS